MESGSNPVDSSQPNASNDSNAPPSESTSSVNVRGKVDIAWDHCIALSKKSMKCNYCMKVINGGGIHRMKTHLAKRKGDVAFCTKVPTNVQYEMQRDLQTWDAQKKVKLGSSSVSHEEQECEEVRMKDPPATTKTKGLSNYFPSYSTPGSQPSIKSVLASKKQVEAADFAVSRWLIDACIPFNAVNSPYFQPMFDAVLSIGPGYKAPSYHAVRGGLLLRNVNEVTTYVESYRKVWEKRGCSIMADGWTDGRQRTLINFLVYCEEGTVFLKSVDASEHAKTAEMLVSLFKEIVDFVGPKNVVQFITDNAANYQAAGKMLKRFYKHIFWTPCAAHCLDLMLEKFDQLSEVERVIEDGRKITKFLYNHTFCLNLMRKHCKGDLLRPAATRFATHFMSLQRLHSRKDNLLAMVASQEWLDHKLSKTRLGIEVKELILSISFWTSCQTVIKVSEPIVRVLRMVDSDEKPAMGYIYEAMKKAREVIKATFHGKEEEYGRYLNIVDEKWESQLGHCLHMTAYYLNPQFFYNDTSVASNHRVWSGFLDTVDLIYHDNETMLDTIMEEINVYKAAKGDFGRVGAIRQRSKILPAQWWDNYGGCTPNLQNLAIRILSQTCSASSCERNWSVFERIHTPRRNRLEHKRLNDLVYVNFNLRLKERGEKKIKFDPISLDALDYFEDWVMEPPIISDEDLDQWLDMGEAPMVEVLDDDGNEVL